MRILDVIAEDSFGTNPKRPSREGARPARGHEPVPRYKVDEINIFPGAGTANKPMPKANLETNPLGAYAENIAKKMGMPMDQLPHYLAQAKKETAGFTTLEEWDDGRKYEGRTDLGNTQPGDGPRFKGRGFLHLTGRWNYTHFGKISGHPEIVTNPELMKDPKIAAVVCTYYWAERVWPKLKNLVKANPKKGGKAQTAKVAAAATKAVQGAKGGSKDRQDYTNYYAQKLQSIMPGKKKVRKAENDAVPTNTGLAEDRCPDCGGPMTVVEHGAASRKLCLSKVTDSELGASALASCKSQGLRARTGEKSHLIGHGKNKVRITVGGKKIKGKAHGGPLPDYGTRKGQK